MPAGQKVIVVKVANTGPVRMMVLGASGLARLAGLADWLGWQAGWAGWLLAGIAGCWLLLAGLLEGGLNNVVRRARCSGEIGGFRANFVQG
jgi:hypothetical protein